MIPQVYKIIQTKKESKDTFTMRLRPDGDTEPAQFLPGQFNMLYAFGVGESAISISGNPVERSEFVHTVRAVGPVTEALARMPVGAHVGVRGPFGSEWPVTQAEGKDVLIVAGGIGLAPLRPVLYHIANEREKYGNVTLLYGARASKDLLYQSELKKFTAHGIEIEVTVDQGDSRWTGNVGVVPALISRARFAPPSTVAMICGPEVMIRYSVMDLEKLGVPAHSIYVSMERSMKCGIGLCGHCRFMPFFLCKDGPVFSFEKIRGFFGKKEV